MSFGNRLRKLRKENKMKQEELAKEFNTSKTAISNYENNYRKPNMDLINDLADYFGVSVDYLLDRTNLRLPAWLNNKTKEEQDSFLQVLNQAQKKGLKPSDIEEIIRIFEKIKPIIDNLSKNE